jgi:hypothetical protein
MGVSNTNGGIGTPEQFIEYWMKVQNLIVYSSNSRKKGCLSEVSESTTSIKTLDFNS